MVMDPGTATALAGAAIGAGIAIAGGAIGAGIAESGIGAAAVGAMVEKEEFFGKALMMTVLPETLIIFALIIAILIMGMVK